MNEFIKKLERSALFNLSLSSKELFHSNFLYWFGQNYPEEFGQMFIHFLNKRPDDTRIISISREKENIDLIFKYSNQQEIILENKVKSVPYFGQLKKYTGKHVESRNYVLLSLSEPLFFYSNKQININGTVWHYMSYFELSDHLKKVVDNFNDPYHRYLIDDYIVFVEGLTGVSTLCMVKEDDFFDFHSLKEDQVYQQLMKIRLHDFYLKKKYEMLAYEVFKKVKSLGKQVMDFGQHLKWEDNPAKIYIGFGMTNAQGLMDLKYRVTRDLVLGIQVQGEHYRMFVEDSNGKIAFRIKEKLENGYWFDFSHSFPGEKIYPKPEKRFNKYGKTFFYKSVKMGTKKRISEVVNNIIKDCEHIENNSEEIIKLTEIITVSPKV
jgi:hypothetical protein